MLKIQYKKYIKKVKIFILIQKQQIITHIHSLFKKSVDKL